MQATNCLWIGGLTENTRRHELQRCIENVSYFPKNPTPISVKIDWKRNASSAFVLFDHTTYADEVRFNLRGKTLPDGASQKLRIDFADPKQFDLRRHNQHEDSSSRHDSRHHSIDLKHKRSRSRSSGSRGAHKKRTHESPKRLYSQEKSAAATSAAIHRKVVSSPGPQASNGLKPDIVAETTEAKAAAQVDDDIIIITSSSENTRRVVTKTPVVSPNKANRQGMPNEALSPEGGKVALNGGDKPETKVSPIKMKTVDEAAPVKENGT